MRAATPVTVERSIPAPRSAVWSVISTPGMHARLDPRCRIESTSGEPGEVGSGYVLVLRVSALIKVHLHYVVVEAEPGVSLAADVSQRDRKVGEQHALLLSDAGGTTLRWTAVQWTGPLTRRIAEASCRRQLATWLEAVEREAVAATTGA